MSRYRLLPTPDQAGALRDYGEIWIPKVGWVRGQVDPKSRKSQADFQCTACGYACHADVNRGTPFP
jgi:hypothetical protein